MTKEERLATEERAKKYAKKTEKDGYLMPRPLELIDAYRQGAEDQDPISRAEQKKIDIEKACEAVMQSANKDTYSLIVANVIIANLRKAMEE